MPETVPDSGNDMMTGTNPSLSVPKTCRFPGCERPVGCHGTRDRALNAEDALKAAHAEIRAQRARIGHWRPHAPTHASPISKPS
jgi:hypothetical protein